MPPSRLRRALRSRVAGALLLGALGCGPRIDQASFAKIATDMPEAEVIALLGPPDESSSFSLGGLSATSATWQGSEGTISIQFLNGKVALKTFTSDPPEGGG